MLDISLAEYKYVIEINYNELVYERSSHLPITLINVLGELVSPNGITNHLNKPSLVLKVVFHSSPAQRQIDGSHSRDPPSRKSMLHARHLACRPSVGWESSTWW